ncbi:MAG TPA: universal stress protein [Bryobacteraceae bacterium]|nr:universal stress protein [Bryobacteraceae bacterium]
MLNCQNILFPVDFSDRCLSAAPRVRSLAEQFQSRITLLHVISLPPAWAESGIPFGIPDSAMYAPTVDIAAMTADREQMLAALAAEQFRGMAVTLRVDVGDAPHIIGEHAEKMKPVLIMLPTHGYGRFRRFLVGSVTAKVLHDVTSPVWTDVHTQGQPEAKGHIRNIVCAVDLDERNVRVIRWASDLAAATSAELTVAHVVSAPESYHNDNFTPFRQFLLDTAAQQLQKLMDHAAVQAKTLMEGGKIAPTIHRVADSLHADVVVIGRGCLPNALGRLRTHAYSIIRESPCPVISV